MVQLANENREDYRLEMELQNYTMVVEMEVETPINFKTGVPHVHIRKS